MGCSDSSLTQKMQNPQAPQEPSSQPQNESHQHQVPNQAALASAQTPQASTTAHHQPVIRKPLTGNQQAAQQIGLKQEPQKAIATNPPPLLQTVKVSSSQPTKDVTEQQKQQEWKPIPILPIVKKHRGYFTKIMYKHHMTEQIIKPMRQYFYSKYDLLTNIKMMRCSGIHLLTNKPFLDLMRLIYQDRFTLNNASNIARAIFQMYKTNHDVFQIMAYLFCQFFWIKKFKENKSTLEIEGMLKEILKKLCQQFPPTVKGQKSVTEDVPFPSCPEKRINLFGDNDGTFFQSYQSLLFQMKIVNEKAKQSLPQFKKLVEYIGQNHQGFNYKSGLKLPTNQYDWFKVLIRVMQKMFPQLKDRKQAIILAAEKQLQKQNKGSMQAVMVSLLDVWINQINQTLKHRGGKAHYFITDLVRGKCMFKNLLAIKKAVNGVITYCANNGFEIVELDNRLKKVTQDVVFKILVGEIVCEFQLALEFQYTQFQFGHAFYEIDRSPMGSIFGSYLFIGKSNNIPFIATVRDTLEMFKGERNNPYETESQRESMSVQRDEELIKVLKFIYESFVQSNK